MDMDIPEQEEMTMAGKFHDLLESTFALKENEGENKVVDLKDAIARHIRPGANIHIAATHCCSGAAILEIARQFRGTKPEFTLIMRGIRDTAVILVHLGLLKKNHHFFFGKCLSLVRPEHRLSGSLRKKSGRAGGLDHSHLPASSDGGSIRS